MKLFIIGGKDTKKIWNLSLFELLFINFCILLVLWKMADVIPLRRKMDDGWWKMAEDGWRLRAEGWVTSSPASIVRLTFCNEPRVFWLIPHNLCIYFHIVCHLCSCSCEEVQSSIETPLLLLALYKTYFWNQTSWWHCRLLHCLRLLMYHYEGVDYIAQTLIVNIQGLISHRLVCPSLFWRMASCSPPLSRDNRSTWWCGRQRRGTLLE